MTTLQEAAMRQSFETWAKPILGDNPTWKESGECELAWQSWKAALAQQGEPVAYITETEQGPMVWTPEMYGEACTYCDDGEFPVPLYTVTALRSQVEYLEKIVEDHAKALAQQGEPVAWAIYDKRGGSKSIHWAEQHTDGNAEMYNAVPLYTAAPAPQPAQGDQHEQLHN